MASSSKDSSAYPRQVARLVAAELLKSKNIEAVQASTLDVLEDLLIRYILELSRQSKQNAEIARRTNINPMDVIIALRSQGVFLPELELTRRSAPDVDFAQGVSEFPVHKRVQATKRYGEMKRAGGEGDERFVGAGTVIPPHFPALPDVHAFVSTDAYEMGEKGVAGQMKTIVDQKEKIGEALVKLAGRVKQTEGEVAGGGETAPTVTTRDDTQVAMDAVDAKTDAAGGMLDVDTKVEKETDALEKNTTEGDDKTPDARNPFLMPVKWEDKKENAISDIIELLRVEKAARLALDRKRERDTSVAHAGADVRSAVSGVNGSIGAKAVNGNDSVEFKGFTWIAKSGARAPGVYDSGQGDIQDKVAVESLLAKNQGHEREADMGGAEELI